MGENDSPTRRCHALADACMRLLVPTRRRGPVGAAGAHACAPKPSTPLQPVDPPKGTLPPRS
eukprot:scaffold12729_cov114-Isochrysis_galbana.AAC.4